MMAMGCPVSIQDALASAADADELYSESLQGVNAGFLSILATSCPGYMSYSFQPNRTLDLLREPIDEFCRKMEDPAYDLGYSNRTTRQQLSRFSRNWLGRELVRKEGGYSGLYNLYFDRKLYVRAFVTVLACRSYKAKHGKYPEALSMLVPEFLSEVPRDPYDGEELRYNHEMGYVWTKGSKLSFDGKVEFLASGKPHFRDWRKRKYVYFLDYEKGIR